MLARLLLIVGVLLVAMGITVSAAAEPFSDAAREERFRDLARELRCLVCQGESILDSNADLAEDMREKVRELMRDGQTDADIKRYMTDRYGDFVLFDPPWRPATWLLWTGPAALAVLSVAVALTLVRRRSGRRTRSLDYAERRRLEALLRRHEGGPS